MATKFDTRQSIQKTALPMAGATAGDQLNAILSSVDAELGKLFEDRNVFITGGGTITYASDQVVVTEALNLEINQKVAGGTPTAISLGASAWSFSANGRMAYAVIDRIAGTATVTTDASALPAATGVNQEVFLIAKRRDTSGGAKRVYLRNGSMLVDGGSIVIGGGTSASVLAFTGMDSDSDTTPDYAAAVPHTLRFITENTPLETGVARLDEQLDKAFGQLRITPGPTSYRTSITGADVTMLDTSVRGQMISNLRLKFDGAQISFDPATDGGSVYAADGVTALGVNFTMAPIANGLYRWFSITLIPGTTNSDGSINGQLIIVPGASDNASKALANKPAFADGLPLGYVAVLGLSGNVDSIGYNSIVQMGIGSGGGGGGSGSGSPLDPEQESTFLFYTRSDFAIDKKTFISTIVGASDQILGLKKISFTAAGQVVTSTNLNGPQVTTEALPVLYVQAKLLYTVGKVDNPVVEFTRDGTNWFPATVEALSSGGNTLLASLAFTDAEPTTLNLKMRITSGSNSTASTRELLGFGLNYVLDTTMVLTGDASYEQRVITSVEASTGLVTLNSVRYTPGTHQLQANVGGHVFVSPDFVELGPGQVLFESGALTAGMVVKFYTGFGLVDGNSITLSKIAGLAEVIVGSSAQVSAGVAQYNTVQAGINAVSNGGKVMVLKGTYSESLTIAKEVFIEGQGRSTVVTGTIALSSGSTGSLVKYVKFGDNVTLATGANNVIVTDCWAATSKTIINNGTNNIILVSGE